MIETEERLLAEFAATLRFESIPAPVARRAEDLFLDWFGSALAGKGVSPVESLFGRLWDALLELEARDGIRRTVRLDTQFRMHPVLGEMVSQCFYVRASRHREHLRRAIVNTRVAAS